MPPAEVAHHAARRASFIAGSLLAASSILELADPDVPLSAAAAGVVLAKGVVLLALAATVAAWERRDGGVLFVAGCPRRGWLTQPPVLYRLRRPALEPAGRDR